MYRKQVWNKSQTYFDGRFNSGAFFIYLTVRPSTDGKRAPLTAINLQAAGSPQQAPPTYIAKMWKLIKFRKNVIFSRNHTDVNPDHRTITKKTIRTTIHENFSKMKNLKVDRWALSLIGRPHFSCACFSFIFFSNKSIVPCKLCVIHVQEDNNCNVSVMITWLIWITWTPMSNVRERR